MTDNEVIISESIPVGEILIKQCMQTLLRDACHRFHIEETFYTLHDTKDNVDGKRYYRCRASLYYKCIGKPKLCIGMFASTQENARDNVATMLLRRLLASTGRIFLITTNIMIYFWKTKYKDLLIVHLSYIYKMQLYKERLNIIDLNCRLLK
jgi:hypothetical protein